MSQEVIPWQERLKAEAKEVAALERPSIASISIRSGMMQYLGQPVPGNRLSVVVIAYAFQRRFYREKWDPNNPANPACFALSLDGQDMVPHEAVKEPVSERCHGCPNDEWGTDIQGGRGKACKENRRMIVLPANALTDAAAIAKAELAMLSIPVTSGRNWGNYVNEISGSYSRPPWAMITQISVHPHIKNQFEVKFEAGAAIGEEYLEAIHKRIEAAQKIVLTPYDEEKEKSATATAPTGPRKY